MAVSYWLYFLFLATLDYINTGNLGPLLDIKSIVNEDLYLLFNRIASMYFVYDTIQFFNKKFAVKALSIQRYSIEVPVVFLCGFALKGIFYFLFVQLVVVPEANAGAL
ncbi:MAG: hypothetical protein EKK39_03715 [Sphingobacteriales bacterium]|uniref:hypothetical protein n=1 Tax=Hydrotalea flava TaxID=714549 RepID=UPI000834AB89|nr:hypothetical protein [Hydrotalea flava]RTL54788.1 MAG: hypothetical protein EKK39_03715 [Sphingobacteriales bacterium]